MFVYSGNGLSMRAVDTTYQAQVGEVLFTDYATPVQLSAAFQNYTSALAAQQVASANQPNPYDWLNRLTAAKQSAIWTSAAANPVILGWLFKAVARTTINLADPVTVGGISFFVAAGILSADDQTLLLTP